MARMFRHAKENPPKKGGTRVVGAVRPGEDDISRKTYLMKSLGVPRKLAVEAALGLTWPDVPAGDDARARMNQSIARWLPDATGEPFTVFASHGARTIPSDPNVRDDPERWGAADDVYHKTMWGNVDPMTHMDMVRAAEEINPGVRNVLLSMCARGGAGKPFGGDPEYCDSLKAVAKREGKRVFAPMGGTSSNSRRTSAGMMLATPEGGYYQTPNTDVAAAIKELLGRARK